MTSVTLIRVKINFEKIKKKKCKNWCQNCQPKPNKSFFSRVEPLGPAYATVTRVIEGCLHMWVYVPYHGCAWTMGLVLVVHINRSPIHAGSELRMGRKKSFAFHSLSVSHISLSCRSVLGCVWLNEACIEESWMRQASRGFSRISAIAQFIFINFSLLQSKLN